MALSDWSAELRLIKREVAQKAGKPAAAGAGRAKEAENGLQRQIE